MSGLVQVSTKPARGALSPLARIVRGIGVTIYLAITVLAFVWPHTNRVFWTMALPLLPLGIVIFGFHAWRKVCPLAFLGSFGRYLDRRGKGDQKGKKTKARRVPKWMEAWYPMVALTVLAVGLAGRLVATNGDGPSLGVMLILLAIAAAGTNAYFTGKTWCNFWCPVGIVERIYTEPNSLRVIPNSQCEKCTACKKNCPDIDQENGYWKDVAAKARRMAYYSFPGLVFSFYFYYWLRAGDWDAYFGGDWTLEPFESDMLFGQGFFFAPAIPPIVAAPLSLAAFMALTYFGFSLLERALTKRIEDEEARRHVVLTTAAFTAFNTFYVFAGAPSLLRIPGGYGVRALAFVAPLVSTLFLAKRMRRTRRDYMEERSAKKLLRKWKFDEPPPDNPAAVFAAFKAHEHAHDQQLAVYRDAVREVYSDGIVTPEEEQVLLVLRNQLGVSDNDHRAIVEDEGQGAQSLSVEQRLQLEGYRQALTQSLRDGDSEQHIALLRSEYNVDVAQHDRLMAEIRGSDSPVIVDIKTQLGRLERIRDNMAGLNLMRKSGAFDFALFALGRSQERIVRRILEAFPLLGDAQRIRRASQRIVDAEHVRNLGEHALAQRSLDRRKDALDELADLVEASFVEPVRQAVLEPLPNAKELPDIDTFHRVVADLLESVNPYERAGVLYGIGFLEMDRHAGALVDALVDEEALVREVAVRAAIRAPSMADAAAVLAHEDDPDEGVRRAVADFITAKDAGGKLTDTRPLRVVEGKTIPPIPNKAFSGLGSLDRILFLRCVPLFVDLEIDDLHGISRFATERVAKTGEPLCRQGDMTDELFVITSGVAEVAVFSANSSLMIEVTQPTEQAVVAKLGTGDVVGELAAIDRSPRSATVRAVDGDVHYLEIRGEDFRRSLVQRRDVAPKIMSTLTRRLRETLAQLRA